VKKLVLLVVLMLAATGAMAQAPSWLAWFGLDHNSYPGGSQDPFNLFGTFEGDSDNYYAGMDTVNPPPASHQVEVIFRGDQNGNNPTYPSDGLSWDIREPYNSGYKIWKLDAIIADAGYTCDIVYNFDAFNGYPLPANFYCKLDVTGDAPSDPGNLALYEYDLNHLGTPGGANAVIANIAQTGGTETWYIIAGVPEPPIIQLAGLLLGALGIGFARFRK
jgi:hypothetical protein